MKLSKKDAAILLDIIKWSEYSYKERAVKYMHQEGYREKIYRPKLDKFEYIRSKIRASQGLPA